MDLNFLGCRKDKLEQLNSKNIHSLEDLAKWLPRVYHDFRSPKLVKDLVDGAIVSLHLLVTKAEEKTTSRGTSMVVVRGKDAKGGLVSVNFFNSSFVLKKIQVGQSYLFCGKVSVSVFNGNDYWSMSNPYRFSQDIESLKRIIPVYRKVTGMSEDYLINLIQQALALVDKEDYLEHHLQKSFGLPSYSDTVSQIHYPETLEEIEQAKRRYLFDDLFLFNYNLKEKNQDQPTLSSFKFKRYTTVKKYLSVIPFELTNGQVEALRRIAETSKNGNRINALVQGDVGSGKTVVAMMSMLMAYDSGYQSVLMAPTNVLAKQHYFDIVKDFEPLGVKVAFLSSEVKASERKKLYKEIEEGSIHVVVGTSSVISKEVKYHNLALTIVDEEHKFGVAQRELLKEKAMIGVHSVSMSATPIPRTLAMSLYGEGIDVITINTLPKGRKPVETLEINGDEKIFQFILEELKKGHQAYIVCPIIEDSESERLAEVESVESVFKKANHYFAQSGFKTMMVNGKMKQDEINYSLEAFVANEVQVLVSTTIVEVGVNVPNATVICIKNAERFGLAQMHQLRGRVGRSCFQSYCLLQVGTETEMAREKVSTMCFTNDGFVVAKKDLELRGTGDFIGTSQSGDNKYVMLMMANPELNLKIKEEINAIYADKKRASRYKAKLTSDETIRQKENAFQR